MLMTQKLSHLLLLVFLSIILTSCGFHLRGSESLDNDGVFFVTVPKGSFELELKDALLRSGAELSNDLAASDLHVNVSQAGQRREIGTLNERGTVDSYRLIFTVSYNVTDAQGKVIKASQTLAENRHYIFSPSEVIESEFEEQALRSSMEKDISLRIVRQLSLISAQR